jgi:hypothetical protein
MNIDFLFPSFATDRHSLSAVTSFTKEEEQALADYITLNDRLPGHLFTKLQFPVFSLLDPTDALTPPRARSRTASSTRSRAVSTNSSPARKTR